MELEILDNGKCAFCGRGDDDPAICGKLMTKKGTTVHYLCMLLSCNLRQRGNDAAGIMGFLLSDIKKELSRGVRLKCFYCKCKGATIGCSIRKCTKSFHFPCGLENNSLHQYFGQFCSFCMDHRTKQAVPPLMNLAELALANAPCPMCLDLIDVYSSTDTIMSPCCKNACFHRACVQAQALNAGYFFKCPLCNDKDKYQTEMMMVGIYIPEQDASWEMEENAFQDLLHRHNRCDQPVCRCPGGPDYYEDGSRWEVIICNTCGSQGCHIGCDKMSFHKPRWDCSQCLEICVPPIKKVAKPGGAPRTQQRSQSVASSSSAATTSSASAPAGTSSATAIADRILRRLRRSRATDTASSAASFDEWPECIDLTSDISLRDTTDDDQVAIAATGLDCHDSDIDVTRVDTALGCSDADTNDEEIDVEDDGFPFPADPTAVALATSQTIRMSRRVRTNFASSCQTSNVGSEQSNHTDRQPTGQSLEVSASANDSVIILDDDASNDMHATIVAKQRARVCDDVTPDENRGEPRRDNLSRRSRKRRRNWGHGLAKRRQSSQSPKSRSDWPVVPSVTERGGGSNGGAVVSRGRSRAREVVMVSVAERVHSSLPRSPLSKVCRLSDPVAETETLVLSTGCHCSAGCEDKISLVLTHPAGFKQPAKLRVLSKV